MKNLHRNWNHIIQSNLNVGDLVHYSEQQGYGSSKPFALCIITELCLGKKDRKTRSDWWNKAHPNQRHNPSSSVVTNFVTNTARDNCKFNSITNYMIIHIYIYIYIRKEKNMTSFSSLNLKQSSSERNDKR